MRRTCLAIALGLILLPLVACQPRMPLTRTEATSAARNWCLRDGHAWGDPVEATEPGAPDANQHRWWTIRFKTPDGEHRVLVNAESGWVKLAD